MRQGKRLLIVALVLCAHASGAFAQNDKLRDVTLIADKQAAAAGRATRTG